MMKGIALFLVLAISFGSIKNGPILGDIQNAINQAVLQEAIEEKNQESKDQLNEKKIAESIFSKLRKTHKTHNKRKRKLKKRMSDSKKNLKGRSLNYNIDNDNDITLPIDLLLNNNKSDDNYEKINDYDLKPLSQINRSSNPFGLGFSNLFNNRIHSYNDIEEESPVDLYHSQSEPNINLLKELLNGYPSDQENNDLNSMSNHVTFKKRRIRKRRIHKRHKKITLRKRKHHNGLNKKQPFTPYNDKLFDNTLKDILNEQLSKMGEKNNYSENHKNETKEDEDKESPTFIILQASDEPQVDSTNSLKALDLHNNTQENNISMKPEFFNGILNNKVASNNSNVDNLYKNNRDSPYTSTDGTSGYSFPMQLIGGFLSGLLKGLTNIDIDEEKTQKPLINNNQINKHKKVNRIRKVHRKKSYRIRRYKKRSRFYKRHIHHDRANLPHLNNKTLKFPLLGGMYNRNKDFASNAYPTLGHGKYIKNFKPLSISDYINSPSTVKRTVFKKRRIHKKRFKRRIIHRKKQVTRPAQNDNTIKDIVNSLYDFIPNIKRVVRI